MKATMKEFGEEKTGIVYYLEFMQAVLGQMSGARKRLVEQVFNALDIEGRDAVELNDIKGEYNARNHPDVRQRKITEDQALGEFIETFEMHHNLMGPHKDQKVAFNEFCQYYNFISCCIEDDKHFQQLLTSVWKLPAEETKVEYRSEVPTAMQKTRPLSVTKAAPFGTSDTPTDYTAWKRAGAGGKSSEAPPMAAGYPSGPKYEKPRTEIAPTPEKKERTPSKNELAILTMLRKALISRGARGIFGLCRAFSVWISMALSRLQIKKDWEGFR